MGLPRLSERQLVLTLVGCLAVAMIAILALVPHPTGSDPIGARDAAPPAAPSTARASGAGSGASSGVSSGASAEARSGTSSRAPSRAPSATPSTTPPGHSTDPTGTGSAPGGPTQTPGPPGVAVPGSGGPQPPRPPRTTRPGTPPPPLVTGLPEPASAVDRLVAGFPPLLTPPTGSVVEASSLGNDGTRAEVSLVATTSESASAVVSHYRDRLREVGFDQSTASDTGEEAAATFARGPETVVVTAAPGSFALFATVVPDPEPLGGAAGGAGDTGAAGTEGSGRVTTPPVGEEEPTPQDPAPAIAVP